MRIDHLEMPLVDGQIDRFADGAARMMDERREIGELHEIAEVLDRAIAPTLVEIMHEGRAVVGREDHGVAADDDVARGVPRVLHITGRGRCAELAGEAAGKAHPLALDFATGPFEQGERARRLAKLDADFLQQGLRVALDDCKSFLAEHFRERNGAGYIGN